MTKEEAIKILKSMSDISTQGEAIDMAIEALSAQQTDLISRADAIEALRGLFDMRKSRAKVIVECFGELLKALPSADADMSEYADRLWKIAYERGKREASADAVQGEWIKKQVFNPELDKYVPFIECSVCGYEPYYGGSEYKFNYCANCGAKMKGGAE